MSERKEELVGCLLALVVLVGGACALGFFVKEAREQAAANRRERSEAVVSSSFFARTVKHDGHWWIFWNGSDHVSHHPDCPCGGSEAEKEE